MATNHDIVGVALAGGQSARMGRDKTLFTWPPGAEHGKPLWQHAVDRLRDVTDEVVVADAGRCLAPPSTELQSVFDGVGKGPVAGVLGAAAARPGRRLLVLAADLPLVPTEWLRFLVQVSSEEDAADWVVPSRTRGLEPLCSVFGPRAVDELRRRADSGVFDLYGLAAVPGLRVRAVDAEGLGRFGKPEDVFLNVNRAEDWSRVEALQAARSGYCPPGR